MAYSWLLFWFLEADSVKMTLFSNKTQMHENQMHADINNYMLFLYSAYNFFVFKPWIKNTCIMLLESQ